MELTIDAALQRAIEAHKAGQLEDADRLYTAILKAAPDHPDANHNLGVLAVSIGKTQEALPFFEVALKSNPSITQFWLTYIEALLKLNRISDAQTVLERAKDKGAARDKLEKIEKKISDAAHKQLKSEKSVEDSITSKFQDPPHEQLTSLTELYGQRQFQKALKYAESLKPLYPNSYFLYNFCGAIYQEFGQGNDAVEAYIKAQNINPYKSDAFRNMGNALKDQGKFDDAIHAYKTALTVDPKDAYALNNLGVIYQIRGQLDEARKAYDDALECKSDFAEAHNNLGNTLKGLGRLVDAEIRYKSALALKPTLTEARRELGNLFLAQERFEEAVVSFKEVLEAKNNVPKVHMSLGTALAKLGRNEKAVESFKQAICLDPGLAEAHLRLGRTYQELGRLDDAVFCFQKAFKERTKINLNDDDVLAPATISLHFELTNKCNFHCTFCPSDSQTRGIGSMDVNLIKSLYTETAEKNLGNVVSLHLMGEPTLHPQLIEILNFAALKKIKTDLVTNGSTLVAKTVPKILDSLYGTITASHMTPTQDTYQFRGDVRLSWERYIGNIRLLIREYMLRLAQKEELKCDLVIRVMATQDTASNVTVIENSEKASSILKEWNDYVAELEKEFGMNHFNRKDHNDNDLLQKNRHASVAYPLQNGIKLVFWRAFTFANTRVGDEFELKKQKITHFCPNPFTDVGVLWNGDVTLCGLDHDGELKVGNIRDSSIEEVINSTKARQLRASMLGQQPLPSLCQNCQAKPVKRISSDIDQN